MSRSTFFLFSGIVLVLGGVLALFLPLAASLTVTLIVGWTFIATGILHLIAAFREEEHRAWNGLFGLASLLLGVSFIFNPLGGMLSLTALLGILFGISGVLQLWLAWQRRETDNVVFLALSGVVSLALAVLIFTNFFAAAATVPGILLAIELISTGIGLITLREKLAKAVDQVNADRAAEARTDASPTILDEGVTPDDTIDPRTGAPLEKP